MCWLGPFLKCRWTGRHRPLVSSAGQAARQPRNGSGESSRKLVSADQDYPWYAWPTIPPGFRPEGRRGRNRRGTAALHADRLARLGGRPYRLSTAGWEAAPSFGFDFLADAIAKVILVSEPQLTLAVYGQWGIGKTTLLHAIDERVSEKCALVWFDMWEYKNQEHVIPHLLDAIADALPPGSQAARGLSALARVALASASLKAGNVSFSGKDLLGELDRLWAAPKIETRQLQRLIQTWRRDTEKRIVVIVDNLDRCMPEQSVTLLEQITSLFGFPGVVFVIAADRERLAQAIELKNKLSDGEGLV